MRDERVLVLGVGNPLVRDEGVGVRVAEILASSFTFPPNVTVLDAGTMGMSILNLIRDADYVLVVDAVTGTGAPPGTVIPFSAEEVVPNQVMHSLHDVRFADVLEAAELLGCRPQSDFVGVQVADLNGIDVGLSPAVEAALPRAVGAVLDMLSAHGIRVQRTSELVGAEGTAHRAGDSDGVEASLGE